MALNPTEETRQSRSVCVGLQMTPEQESILRRAADIANKSMAQFILDSACQAAEQTLLEQRLFTVSGDRVAALMELLDRPEQGNPGLHELFSRSTPWTVR